MKLYYTPGVCSQAVHIALTEANLPHTLEKVDLSEKTTETGADFTLINTLGYVPALELDDGSILLEAPAILQYVADLKPDSQLAPANGTLGRVRLQERLNHTASEFHKSFGPFFAAIKPEGALKKQALTKLHQRFALLETELSDGREFIMGETFTVADTYIFVVANWAGIIDFDISEFTHIKAYLARIAERPAVREVYKREGMAA